jgi:ubiquinone biosynthesis protein
MKRVARVMEEMVKIPYICAKRGQQVVWGRLKRGQLRELSRPELIGDLFINCIDGLGPIYGKIGQVGLGRVPEKYLAALNKTGVDAIYDNWPALSLKEVKAILDSEFSDWEQELTIEAKPLGVASMAQVHAAVDRHGKKWALKIIRPHAAQRLLETVQVIEELSALGSKASGKAGKKMFAEWNEICRGLKAEINLEIERENIERFRSVLDQHKRSLIKVPQVWKRFSSSKVLAIECFEGISFKKLVSDKTMLPPSVREKLAQNVLKEILIQVFEFGLFHGDPHAGNLMLLGDGSIGLFDWGLTGELTERDRRYISSILKAVLALDLNGLVTALQAVAKDEGVEVDQEKIREELKDVMAMMKEARESGEKLGAKQLLEQVFASADRLGVTIPSGLLMMAKTMLTIEGLARGIFPEVNWKRTVTPILFNLVRPNFGDLIRAAKKWPKFLQENSKFGQKRAS